MCECIIELHLYNESNPQRQEEETKAAAEAKAVEEKVTKSARSLEAPTEADCEKLQSDIEKLLAAYDAAVLELYRLDREHSSIQQRRDACLTMLAKYPFIFSFSISLNILRYYFFYILCYISFASPPECIF